MRAEIEIHPWGFFSTPCVSIPLGKEVVVRRSPFITLLLLAGLTAACSESGPVAPEASLSPPSLAAAPADKACWGQATKVFAALGDMGIHSSSQSTPRSGLMNLARDLYDDGVISSPDLQALGVFVASSLGLTVEACGV